MKIGYTRNLESRIRTLRTGAPYLRLIASIPGNLAVESWLHATFADNREAGEWFRYSDRLRQFISNPAVPNLSALKKNMAAKKTLVDVAAIGKKGGKARAARMTPEERAESARKAVQARWAKAKKKAAGK